MIYPLKPQYIKHLSIFILFSFILSVKSAAAPTHLVVTRVGPCYDGPSTLVSISELSIFTQTYNSALSGSFNISEDISNGWRVKVTIDKCVDLRNVDSCDHFKSLFVVNDGCNDDNDEEFDIYTILFHYVSPRLECPVQAGKYKIVEYPFFTEDNYVTVYESKISTSVFGYIYRMEGFTADQRKVLCVDAFLQLLYMREHVWTPKRVNGTTIIKPPPTSQENVDSDK